MTAWIFPGQGAQYVGMGKDFYDTFLTAKETFQEADELLEANISRLIFQGPESELIETKNSQLAILITTVAILRAATEQLSMQPPSSTAGLSLGEYTALYASKRLSFKDALLLVRQRALFMNEACEKTPGTMAAVLGLDAKAIEQAITGLNGVWVANYNAPGQTVISGTKEGVLKASEALRTQGAKRVIPLTVHGAFHSPLMKHAQDQLAPFIQNAHFQQSELPIVMNALGAATTEIRPNLIAQVTSPVRWEQSIHYMQRQNTTRFIEIGPGKTLSGLNRKMEAPTLSIDKVSDLESIYATA